VSGESARVDDSGTPRGRQLTKPSSTKPRFFRQLGAVTGRGRRPRAKSRHRCNAGQFPPGNCTPQIVPLARKRGTLLAYSLGRKAGIHQVFEEGRVIAVSRRWWFDRLTFAKRAREWGLPLCLPEKPWHFGQQTRAEGPFLPSPFWSSGSKNTAFFRYFYDKCRDYL